jgi:hypothetical protein
MEWTYRGTQTCFYPSLLRRLRNVAIEKKFLQQPPYVLIEDAL